MNIICNCGRDLKLSNKSKKVRIYTCPDRCDTRVVVVGDAAESSRFNTYLSEVSSKALIQARNKELRDLIKKHKLLKSKVSKAIKQIFEEDVNPIEDKNTLIL